MKIAPMIVLLASGAALGFAVAQEGKKPDLKEMMKPPEPLQDKFLESLVGTWKGPSDFMGEAFEGTATYEWVLGHQFLKGTEKSVGPSATYFSEGFWKVEKGEYLAWWFDSMGSAGSMKGKLEGDTLASTGTDPMFGPFRALTKRVGADEITWTMESDPERDGTFAKIGEGTMRRVKGGTAK